MKCILCGEPIEFINGVATISILGGIEDPLGPTGIAFEYHGLSAHLRCIEDILPIVRENIIEQSMRREREAMGARP